MSIRKRCRSGGFSAAVWVAAIAILFLGCEPMEETDEPMVPDDEETTETTTEATDLEANKEVVEQFLETVSAGELDRIDEFVAEDVTDNDQMLGMEEDGVEGVRQWFTMVHTSFSDLNYDVQEMIAEDDKVVVHSNIEYGTHEEEFMGIPASDNEVTMANIDIFRLEDGLIVERWGQGDTVTFLEDLGVNFQIPSPEAAALDATQ